MSALKILPGTIFPDISLPTVGGGTVHLRANGKPKLIVIYRGSFCPFCRGTLQEVNSKLATLREAGIEVVAVSADKEEVATVMVEELSLGFPVAYGLGEDMMHQLGLYVTDPTNYISQNHRLAEPGYFFLTAMSKIQYVSIASHPMGGRVNVDHLIAGYEWSVQRAKESPEFANVVWGSVENEKMTK
eukprot:gene14333-15857_t